MISTGNDIIALAETDVVKTSGYRFYARILSPDELSLFAAPHSPFAAPCSPFAAPHSPFAATGLSFSTFVWLLWSIKESVYKYVSRSNQRLAFAPLKIPVSGLSFQEDYYEGTICYAGLNLFSRSFLRDEAIMTIVNEGEDFSSVRWGVQVIGDSSYSTQSARVRTCTIQSLSADLPGAALRIVKTPDGPPEVWDGDRLLDIPLSLAHHGRYVAWSYRLPANSSS